MCVLLLLLLVAEPHEEWISFARRKVEKLVQHLLESHVSNEHQINNDDCDADMCVLTPPPASSFLPEYAIVFTHGSDTDKDEVEIRRSRRVKWPDTNTWVKLCKEHDVPYFLFKKYMESVPFMYECHSGFCDDQRLQDDIVGCGMQVPASQSASTRCPLRIPTIS